METFGTAEIWELRASFMMVGTDAKADIPLPENVRRYYFPGARTAAAAADSAAAKPAAGCELPIESVPERADAHPRC